MNGVRAPDGRREDGRGPLAELQLQLPHGAADSRTADRARATCAVCSSWRAEAEVAGAGVELRGDEVRLGRSAG